MPKHGVPHSQNEDFKEFLFDYIGEDRNGGLVTVLSALARLGIDPWREASELSRLPESEAVARLDTMMLKLHEVPSVIEDHAAIAQRLISRLPRRGRGNVARSASNDSGSSNSAPPGQTIRIPGALMILVVLGVLVLAQVLSFGVATP